MKKLIEALHVIKDECKKNNGCNDCPLCVEGACGVRDSEPCVWKINDETQKALL